MDTTFFYSPVDEISSVNASPDVYELFAFYNKTFFHNALEACELKWSKRMTLCAGTCQLSSFNSCTITLSESLLQFRTNNEIKETLLHEMIHAYLFLTEPQACKENGGHGKEFQYLMNFINEITNLNITIYHSFNDEVDLMRKHVWKCDGKCVSKPPFFGIVKRAMNRAPGPYDSWWERHMRECGGSFTKIEGPDMDKNMVKVKNEKKKAKGKNRKITDFLAKNDYVKEENSRQPNVAESQSTNLTIFDEKSKQGKSAKQIFLLKFLTTKNDGEFEILRILIADNTQVKELKTIVSLIFNGFSVEELDFAPTEYGQLDMESTLAETVLIQGILKFRLVFCDLIEYSLLVDFVYEISAGLNPVVKEAEFFPKVFGISSPSGSEDDYLRDLDKKKINEKLKSAYKESASDVFSI